MGWLVSYPAKAPKTEETEYANTVLQVYLHASVWMELLQFETVLEEMGKNSSAKKNNSSGRGNCDSGQGSTNSGQGKTSSSEMRM